MKIRRFIIFISMVVLSFNLIGQAAMIVFENGNGGCIQSIINNQKLIIKLIIAPEENCFNPIFKKNDPYFSLSENYQSPMLIQATIGSETIITDGSVGDLFYQIGESNLYYQYVNVSNIVDLQPIYDMINQGLSHFNMTFQLVEEEDETSCYQYSSCLWGDQGEFFNLPNPFINGTGCLTYMQEYCLDTSSQGTLAIGYDDFTNSHLTNEILFAKEVSIFPNPFSEEFNINNRSLESIISIEIFNLSGKKIFYKRLGLESPKNIQLNTNEIQKKLQQGIYFCKVTMDSGIKIIKIIKE